MRPSLFVIRLPSNFAITLRLSSSNAVRASPFTARESFFCDAEIVSCGAEVVLCHPEFVSCEDDFRLCDDDVSACRVDVSLRRDCEHFARAGTLAKCRVEQARSGGSVAFLVALWGFR